MASEAVVDLVVNAAGADAEINSQLTQIVNDAEQHAPPIELDAVVNDGSSHDVSSAVADIVSDAEQHAAPIELSVDVDGSGVEATVAEIVAEAEQHAAPIELAAEVDVPGEQPGVNAAVAGIVEAAEASAPSIDLEVTVDSAGRLRDARGRFVRRVTEEVAEAAEEAGDEGGRSFGARMLSRIGSTLRAGMGSALSAGMDGLRSAAPFVFSHPVIGTIGLALAAGIVAVALPLIGALLAGSFIFVGGLGIIGLGAVILKDEPEVVAAATKLKDRVLEVFKKAAGPLKTPFVTALGALASTAERLAPQIEESFSIIGRSGAILSLTDGISKLVENLLPGLNKGLGESGDVFEGIEILLGKVGEGLGSLFARLEGDGPVIKQALSDFGTLISQLLDKLGLLFSKLTDAYSEVRTFAKNVEESFRKLYDTLVGHSIVPDLINRIIELFRSLPGRAAGALASLGGAIVGRVRSAMDGMVASVRGGINTAAGVLRSLPGRARSALGDLVGVLFPSGSSLMQGFVDGIRSKFGAIAKAVADNMAEARKYLPFSPAKKGPFSGKGWTLYSGRKVIEDFVRGIEQEKGTVAGALSRTLRGEPRLGGSPGAALASNASAALSARVSQSLALVGAPSVAVYIGNERLSGFVDTRIDGRNQVRDRQAAQGARF